MSGDIIIKRYSFYKNFIGPTLRYLETEPQLEHVHHVGCGCTVDVDVRPAGTPLQSTQSTRYIETHGNLTIELEMDSSHTRGIWAYWAWPLDLEKLPFSNDLRGHAYFWPNNGLKIEIVGMPLPILDHVLLTKMFFGRRADTSRLFNGHSPSHIVDLDKLDGEVWLHRCTFGKESISLLSNEDEKAGWTTFVDDMKQAFEAYEAIKAYESFKDTHTDLVKLRNELLAHPMASAKRAVDWARHVLTSLSSTAMLSAAEKLIQPDADASNQAHNHEHDKEEP